VSDTVLDQAIDWLVKLESSQHAPGPSAACLAWRQADPRHETTWQALQEAQHCFTQARELPTGVALRSLHSPNRRHTLKVLALGILATGLGSGALQQSPWRVSLADYSTGVGERRRITLADGSLLQLNSRSAVDVHFTASQRLITLREGQIHLRCAADPTNRLLCVDSGSARLSTLDATFDVSLHAQRSQLSVDHGAVAIQLPGQRPLRATAGQQYLLDEHAERLTDAPPEASAWTRGLLVARHMPLQQLAQTLGRQRAGWVSCDPAVAALRVSGVFQLDDSANALQSLTHTLPVRLTWRTPLWVRIVPA